MYSLNCPFSEVCSLNRPFSEVCYLKTLPIASVTMNHFVWIILEWVGVKHLLHCYSVRHKSHMCCLGSIRRHYEVQCDVRDWSSSMRWLRGLFCSEIWRYFVFVTFIIALEQQADIIFRLLEKQNYGLRWETEGSSGISVACHNPEQRDCQVPWNFLYKNLINLTFLLLVSAGM